MKNVFNKTNVDSDHRIVRCKMKINLGRESNSLVRKSLRNLMSLHDRKLEFAIGIQNRHADL